MLDYLCQRKLERRFFLFFQAIKERFLPRSLAFMRPAFASCGLTPVHFDWEACKIPYQS
jgi:hypothetical protein